MTSSSDTDRIIRSIALQAGNRPFQAPMRLERALCLASLASLGVAVALIFLFYGVQPDLRATLAGGPFRHKLLSMLTLALGGLLAVAGAARPGASRLWIAAFLPGLALLASGALADRSGLPFLGHSGVSVPGCLFAIILLSVPALFMILTTLRSMGVVTRPGRAGATAGVLAGALGAAAYALACRNDGGLFVAVWYSAALALVGIIGAIAGRRWLAW